MSTEGVTIITPTGGRPEAFALCEKFVLRQTYTGPVQWIVVNDCHEQWTPPKRDKLIVTVVHPTPRWQFGQNTQARNLLVAIPEVQYDNVVFFEDDDAYKPEWLDYIVSALTFGAIAGEIPARYYHVPTKRYRINENKRHASLCQTGIRKEYLNYLKSICLECPQFIDVALWRSMFQFGPALIESKMSVGIKGLPGRMGIGMGHRPTNGGAWHPDPDLAVLTEWIGDDVELYKRYMQ
jgi:glycosyltransferase involved in cell wall biosynthesis